MDKGKAAAGGIVVGVVILVKLAMKTALFGAIFGAAFGGASYAKTEYEMSVDHMKTEADYYNQKHGGEMLNEDTRIEHVSIDETQKRIIFDLTVTDITSEQVNKLKVSQLRDAENEDKDRAVFGFKRDKDLMVLFEHDWKVEYRSKTSDGVTIEDYTVNKQDVM